MSGDDGTGSGLLVSGRFPELEEALCRRVAELKHGLPLAPLTVVVGSSAVRTHVGDLLIRRLGGVANVAVVTFARYAADLVARASQPPVLSGLARERLVRRLVAAHAPALAYFRPVADRPHFAAALAATFADLREGCVDPRSPWTDAPAADAAGGAVGQSAAALGDLGLLYAAYCDALGALGVTDRAGVLLAAAGLVTPSAGSSPRIVFYGLYDLNRAQEVLAVAALCAGADAFVPVPRDGEREGVTLLEAARATGLVERCEEGLPPDRDASRIAGVWRPSGVQPDRPELTGDGTLAVLSVPDERSEAREAVRAVVAAAERGVPLRDCAVVVPRGDDVEPIAAALSGAGLPVACRRPDRSTGPRLLLALGECLRPQYGEPFARRAVIDLLTAVPLRGVAAEPGDTALWLDEAREAGVVCRLEQWLERVPERCRALERRVADLESRVVDVDVEDDAGGERLECTRARLRASCSLERAVAALAGACGRLPERAGWAEWGQAFADLAAALFPAEAAEPARDAAGRLGSLALLGEQADLATAVEALRDLLAGGTVSQGRVGRDGVAVLTPLEVRGLSFSTVVVTGLAEGGLPVRARPDPLLGDAARRGLNGLPGVRLPLAEQRDAESAQLFAFACEAARDRLVLLAPRTDAATGRPRLPSRYLLRLASLVAGRPVGQDEFLTGRPLAAVWHRTGAGPSFADGVTWVDERERDAAALLGLSARGCRSAAGAYLSAVLGSAGPAERRLGAWRSARSPVPGAWDGLLGGEAQSVLAQRHPFLAEVHPTTLERYISCPFTFLLRSVYELEAPQEPGDSLDMDAMEFGSLVHAILETVYEHVIAGHLDLQGALAAVPEAWRSHCAEAERSGVTGAELAWSVRKEVMLDDLREAVRRDPVFACGDGDPVAVEWRFGERHERVVTLVLDEGRSVRFAGRLDRVDRVGGGARVIDYKTGAGGTERQRLKDRLSIQLPVYQLAVRQWWPDLAGQTDGPASVTSAYRLVTRRGGFDDVAVAEAEPDAQDRLRSLVAGALELTQRGLFPRTRRDRCDYCDVAYACGVSGWARARKREHPALATVAALQGPPAADGTDA